METNLKRTIISLVFLLNTFCLYVFCNSSIFTVVEKRKIDIGDTIIYSAIDIDPVSDGFVLLMNRSYRGRYDLIIKINRECKMTAKYEKTGNGPGELRTIKNIVSINNMLYACEWNSPYVHRLTANLDFDRDFRIKKGGKIFDLGLFFGIWCPNHSNDEDYILALYDKENLEFIRFGYKIKEIPALTPYWGGLCRITPSKFAGVYSNEYQINIFDKEINLIQKLINSTPGHIKKYYKNPENSGLTTIKSLNWLKTWSKLEYLFYANDKFIIFYSQDDKLYFDVYSAEGELLKGFCQGNKKSRFLLFHENHFWRIEYHEDADKGTYDIYLVKEKFLL